MAIDSGGAKWRVRLRDQHGRVVGAGTMLDELHVLTCAHVVEGPEARTTVEFVGLGDDSSGIATVHPDFWLPEEGECGDLAVLRLHEPEPRVVGAQLYRMPLGRGRLVYTNGFPKRAPNGLIVDARLTGQTGPRGEWIQLNRTPDSEPVEQGFSGAAVVDSETDRVIGIVVTGLSTAENKVFWMIPVETMLAYLPKLDKWATGSPAVDASIIHRSTSRRPDATFSREIDEYLRYGGSGLSWVVVTGDAESTFAASLRRAIVLADRENSPRLADESAMVPGSRPPVGNVALAVDATDRSAGEVGRRIEERLGYSVRSDRLAGMTLVIDAIDDAANPHRLIEKVLMPLAVEASKYRFGLVLAFRRESSPGVSRMREHVNALPQDEDVPNWIEVFAEKASELGEIAGYYDENARRFVDVSPFPPRAAGLGLVASQLSRVDLAKARSFLRRYVGRLDAALSRGREIQAALDAMQSRRAELRGRMDAYGAMAAHHGLGEDDALDRAYATAWKLLYEGRCDLDAAARAVERYVHLVSEQSEGPDSA